MSASGTEPTLGRKPSPVWSASRPDPLQPVLVAGPAASAVMNGAGEFRLDREARGGPSEWGGVYGQDVRLTGAWAVRWRRDGTAFDLPSTLRSITAWRWGLQSHHDDGVLAVDQEVTAFERAPGIRRKIGLCNASQAPVQLELEASIVPFLAPVILEGVKPYVYRLTMEGSTIEASSHGSALLWDSRPAPLECRLDDTEWTGRTAEGEFGIVSTTHRIDLAAGGSTSVEWAITGGTHRWTVAHPTEGKEELARPIAAMDDARARWEAWVAGTPDFQCPDAEITEGYRLARDALRCLYSAPEPGFTGLVAGFPWYSALWCRDLAWMLPAVIWLGDHEWAADSLETVFRFQAGQRLAIMSAEAGELPMEVCPGPIFLFGTSDTTLYYPGVVRRLWKHAGNHGLLEKWRPVLDRIAYWAESRCDRGTGLLHNGGEIQGLKDAGASLGRVHFGIDAVDTTIWDSADRRDHAVDIQALGYEAFRSLAEISDGFDDASSARLHLERADHLAETVRNAYRWSDEQYFYDSLHADGTPVRHVRPNALRLASVGILTGDDARGLVHRAAQPDLSTPWGVRTLSARDPSFNPTAYHEGQVWTIATAWAADAALQAGETTTGLEFLRVNARRLVAESGLANECYRGDRAEPYNSCFLLGFSIAPFLTTLFDRLWGLELDAAHHAVKCVPRFPREWDQAELGGVRVGAGRLRLRFASGVLKALWDGPEPLTFEGEAGSVTLEPGVAGHLDLGPPRQGS